MYIKSSICYIEDFEVFLLDYIKEQSEECGAGSKHSDPKITEVSNGVYRVEEWTAMFNGFDDIPSWMIDMIVKSSLVINSCENGLPSEILEVGFDIKED